MKKMLTIVMAALVVAAILICGCTGETTTPPTTVATTEPTAEQTTEQTTAPPAEKDIVETATEAGTFTTLLTALDAANLTETMKGDGPFTVFAPTDAAFEALPAGALGGLLANTTELSRVLTYHVVSGKYMSAEIVGMSSLMSLEGSDLVITTDGGVKVNGANVTNADIECSNGVIHVIDAVMLPP